MEVIMPLNTLLWVYRLLKKIREVAGYSNTENKGAADPERTVQVWSGSNMMLEEWFSRNRYHGVEQPVLHICGIHIKELLVESKGPEIWCFPLSRSCLTILICDKHVSILVWGRIRELGHTATTASLKYKHWTSRTLEISAPKKQLCKLLWKLPILIVSSKHFLSLTIVTTPTQPQFNSKVGFVAKMTLDHHPLKLNVINISAVPDPILPKL